MNFHPNFDKPTLATALMLRQRGVACIPVESDGKRPTIDEWGGFRTAPPSEQALEGFFSNGAGIAIVAGAVQCIDIDTKHDPAIFERYILALEAAGCSEIVERLVIQQTPSGGWHFVFRTDCEPIRNTKLARRWIPNEETGKPQPRATIETRGDGGYFLIAPSEGYTLAQGDWQDIPTISYDEREALLEVARSLDEVQKPREHAPALPAGDLSPGDDYDSKAATEIPALLRSHGWRQCGSHHWTRPGKAHGVSASWDEIPNSFWVFSTSTEFEAEHKYRPWHVFAILECGGDYRRAAAELRRLGFGSLPPERERSKQDDWRSSLTSALQAAPGAQEEAEEYVPRARSILEVTQPDPNDESILLGDRFLCRHGFALLAGPTGVGKSSLTMQFAVGWALGIPTLGIQPKRPLRILLVQGENDEGDLAEQRDGVFAGMNLSQAERATLKTQLTFLSENEATGPALFSLLSKELTANPRDLIILDPVFSYIGGSAKEQEAVSPFLRNMLNPMLKKHNCAGLIVHHTNKPPKPAERGKVTALDLAYVMSGSAEWANAPRAVLALVPHKSGKFYELAAPKRGKRLGWRDHEGKRSISKVIAHSSRGICWREVASQEINELEGEGQPEAPARRSAPKQRATMEDLLALFPDRPSNPSDGMKHVRLLRAEFEERGWPRDPTMDLLALAVNQGALAVVKSSEGKKMFCKSHLAEECSNA